MTKEEFSERLEKNRENMNKAKSDFEKHNKEFDRKIQKVLSLL